MTSAYPGAPLPAWRTLGMHWNLSFSLDALCLDWNASSPSWKHFSSCYRQSWVEPFLIVQAHSNPWSPELLYFPEVSCVPLYCLVPMARKSALLLIGLSVIQITLRHIIFWTGSQLHYAFSRTRIILFLWYKTSLQSRSKALSYIGSMYFIPASNCSYISLKQHRLF